MLFYVILFQCMLFRHYLIRFVGCTLTRGLQAGIRLCTEEQKLHWCLSSGDAFFCVFHTVARHSIPSCRFTSPPVDTW